MFYLGKFERGEAEKLEKEVVKLLNGDHLLQALDYSRALADRIKEDFKNIEKAEFIGRTYSEPGNIKVYLKDKKVVYIELKFLTSGKGTKANIGQNALTELGLFNDGNVIGWEKFRKDKKFDEKVLEYLESFKDYDLTTLSRYKGNEKEKKARYLRDLLAPKSGESIEKAIERSSMNFDAKKKKAAEIVEKILKLAEKDKLDYIAYLKRLKQNKENIKKFTILILLGIHKERNIKKFMEKFDELINSLNNRNFIYVIYYVYKSGEISSEDLTDKVNNLVKAKDFEIEFPNNETNIIIKFKDPGTGNWKRVLRIVLNWKNVFQGIATPCLNIFEFEEEPGISK